jgi:DNA repair protein RecO (recombination protein O)
MSERELVQLEPCFVLHQRPYRNSSQLIEGLSVNHGRVALITRGSRRLQRGASASLQPFTPLRLSWVRHGELGRLTYAELSAESFALTGERLLAGFYLNELLLRLTARGDANAAIFSCYSRCLAELAALNGRAARAVRLFELRLLRALGYGLELDCDAVAGAPIDAGRCYAFEPERGLVPVLGPGVREQVFWGHQLIALRDESLEDADCLAAAKRLLTGILATQLGDRPLKSRLVLKDLFERGLGS